MKKIIVLLVLYSFLSTQVGFGMPTEQLRRQSGQDHGKSPGQKGRLGGATAFGDWLEDLFGAKLTGEGGEQVVSRGSSIPEEAIEQAIAEVAVSTEAGREVLRNFITNRAIALSYAEALCRAEGWPTYEVRNLELALGILLGAKRRAFEVAREMREGKLGDFGKSAEPVAGAKREIPSTAPSVDTQIAEADASRGEAAKAAMAKRDAEQAARITAQRQPAAADEGIVGPPVEIIEGSVEEFMLLDAAEAERQIDEFRKAADAILAKPKKYRDRADNAMLEAIGNSLEIIAEGRARAARGLKPGDELPGKRKGTVYAFLGSQKTAALMRQVAIDYYCVDFDISTEGESIEDKIKNRMAEQGIDVDSARQIVCVSSYDLTEEERRLLGRTRKEDNRFSNLYLPENFFQDEDALYKTLNRTFGIPILDTPAAKAAAYKAFEAQQIANQV